MAIARQVTDNDIIFTCICLSPFLHSHFLIDSHKNRHRGKTELLQQVNWGSALNHSPLLCPKYRQKRGKWAFFG